MSDELPSNSKIVKWGLSDEVLRLHEDGESKSAIARYIADKYSDIEELRNISYMSVGRFLDSSRELEVKDGVEETKDPMKYIEKEFNSKIRDNIQDAEQMNIMVNEFASKLKNNKDISSAELNRIVKSWKDTNDQIRKNLVALRQYTNSNIIRPTQNIIFKKEINIKQMILDLSRHLCPECKKEVNKIINEYEGK